VGIRRSGSGSDMSAGTTLAMPSTPSAGHGAGIEDVGSRSFGGHGGGGESPVSSSRPSLVTSLGVSVRHVRARILSPGRGGGAHKVLFRVALALQRLLRPSLLQMRFERALPALRDAATKLGVSADALIQQALSIRVTTAEVLALRAEFRRSEMGRIVLRGSAEDVARRLNEQRAAENASDEDEEVSTPAPSRFDDVLSTGGARSHAASGSVPTLARVRVVEDGRAGVPVPRPIDLVAPDVVARELSARVEGAGADEEEARRVPWRAHVRVPRARRTLGAPSALSDLDDPLRHLSEPPIRVVSDVAAPAVLPPALALMSPSSVPDGVVWRRASVPFTTTTSLLPRSTNPATTLRSSASSYASSSSSSSSSSAAEAPGVVAASTWLEPSATASLPDGGPAVGSGALSTGTAASHLHPRFLVERRQERQGLAVPDLDSRDPSGSGTAGRIAHDDAGATARDRHSPTTSPPLPATSPSLSPSLPHQDRTGRSFPWSFDERRRK
jgi:hypothetical protein